MGKAAIEDASGLDRESVNTVVDTGLTSGWVDFEGKTRWRKYRATAKGLKDFQIKP